MPGWCFIILSNFSNHLIRQINYYHEKWKGKLIMVFNLFKSSEKTDQEPITISSEMKDDAKAFVEGILKSKF